MDRQRVLHFAKSRTGRVIRTGVASPQPPPTTPTSELPPAPLASIDSDFIVITKRRDETNMAPNVWEQLRKCMPQANTHVHPIDCDSMHFDRGCFYNEQNGFQRPRTYVKLRSAHNLSSQTNAPDLGKEQKLQPQATQPHRLVRHPTAYSSQNRAPNESKYVPESRLQTQTSSQPWTSVSASLKTETEDCNRVNGHAHSSTRQIVCSQMIEHSSKTVPPQSPILKLPQQTCISDSNPHTSPLCPRSPLDKNSLRNGHHEKNHLDMSNHHVNQQKVTSPTDFSRKDSSSSSDCAPRCFVHDQNGFKQQANSSQTSERNTPGSITAPNAAVLRGGHLATDEEPLPELYGISSTVYTSNIRLASERIARAFTERSAEHKGHQSCQPGQVAAQPGNHKVDVKDSCQNRLKTEPTSLQQRHHLVLPTMHTTNQSNTHQNGAVQHQQATLTPIDDSTPVAEPELCWIRASPRTTTNDCASIPNLVSSLDYLSLHTKHITNNEGTPSLTGNIETENGMESEKSSQIPCRDGGKYFHIQSGASRVYNKPADVTDNCGESPFTSINDYNRLDDSSDKIDRTDLKRLLFRLAPVGVSDVWLLERTVCDHSDSGAEEWGSVGSGKSGVNDKTWTCVGHLTNQGSGEVPGHQSDACGSCRNHDESCNQGKLSLEQQARKLKRRSFMLATSSWSDLTFLDSDSKCDNACHRHNIQICGQQDFRDLHDDSGSSSSIFMTPDSQLRRRRFDSISSDRHNSSVGSFYSCQSQTSSKAQPTLNGTGDKDKAKSKRVQGHKHGSSRQSALEESMDSDSSFSGDVSVYYTASDTSFLTSGGASTNERYTSQQSPRPPLPTQWRDSPSNQSRLQGKPDPHGFPRSSTNILSHGPRTSKPAYSKSLLRCYGCGLDDGLLFKSYQQRRRNNSRGVANTSRIVVNPDNLHGRQRSDRKRSRSVPSTRVGPSRRPDSSSKHSVHPRMDQAHGPPSSQPCSSVRDSSLSGSLDSLLLESTMDSMPRIPPSLGRPRRKLYAGFDSQPLPMDSFLSDSSSVYSTQSCSSWGTSKSATVESTSRSLDISARSISSLSSIMTTPTRQDDLFDFFTYSGKRSSVCENSRNLYLGSENNVTDECFKDHFYDKTYSKDSLESVLSNGTTVNVEHMIYTDSDLEQLKPDYDSTSSKADVHDNNGFVPRRATQRNDNVSFNRINNDCVWPKLNKNCNGSTRANSGHQQKYLRGSASASLSGGGFLTKPKYFSTRDLLDLVIASDRKYDGSLRRSRSLERQAQKMYEVILCFN